LSATRQQRLWLRSDIYSGRVPPDLWRNGSRSQTRDFTPRQSLCEAFRRGPCARPMSAFGIYVHWPYCVAKCPYCDFNSHVRARIEESQWVKLIQRELNNAAKLQHPRPEVTSIFFGGGTPSLMSGRAA